MSSALRLLFSSGDPNLSSLLASALGKEMRFTVESRRHRVAESITNGECDVVILDLDSNRDNIADQVNLLEEIIASSLPVLVMSDDEMRAQAMELVSKGGFGYLRKPPSLREMKVMVRRAYESSAAWRADAQTEAKPHPVSNCGDFVGTSAEMGKIYQLIRRVADVDVSVLVTGESGTGKELVARAIHDSGSRKHRPFVAVSCGAFPESLIEAELFGHEKGAFTGTAGFREGFFEKAGDGTLFIDEIGELTPQIQVKLLRVLQQREFCRLGSSNPLRLRARLVFATNRDLQQMVAAGTFRHDLFYRINVVGITVPALRDHAEDIPALAHHFLERYSTLFRRQGTTIEPEALRALKQYAWPGNVRELENVMQRSIIMAEGNRIGFGDLPEIFDDVEVLESENGQPDGTFERQVRDYRLKLANEAIEECNGNKTLAAQKLSISRAYLHRLLRPGAPSIVSAVKLGAA